MSVPPATVWGPVVWRLIHHLERTLSATAQDGMNFDGFLAALMPLLPPPHARTVSITRNVVARLHGEFNAALGLPTHPQPRLSPHEARLTFVTTVLFIKAFSVTNNHGSAEQRRDFGIRAGEIAERSHDRLGFGNNRGTVANALRDFGEARGSWVRSLWDVGLEPFAPYAQYLAKSDPFHIALHTTFTYARDNLHRGFPVHGPSHGMDTIVRGPPTHNHWW